MAAISVWRAAAQARLCGRGCRPATARARSGAGGPWGAGVWRRRPFVRGGGGGGRRNSWSDQDLQDGFDLTGRFLLRNVLEPRGQGHSDARDGFINAVTKHLARITSVS